MILLILFVVTMFLWLLSLIPAVRAPYPWATSVLAWIAVLLLALLTLHQLRTAF